MQSKLLQEACGERTFAVILNTGEEAMRLLQEFAAKERVGGAQVTAIGALSRAKLAYFDWESKQYRPIPVNEQVEVASETSRSVPMENPAFMSTPCSGAATGPSWPATSWRPT